MSLVILLATAKQKIFVFLIVESNWRRTTVSPTNDKEEGTKKIQRAMSRHQNALLHLISGVEL